MFSRTAGDPVDALLIHVRPMDVNPPWSLAGIRSSSSDMGCESPWIKDLRAAEADMYVVPGQLASESLGHHQLR